MVCFKGDNVVLSIKTNKCPDQLTWNAILKLNLKKTTIGLNKALRKK